MKHLNKTAKKILDSLVAGLKEPGDANKIDNSPGTFMAVHVDNLGGNLYAVAHRYVQNGDSVPDPDVEFWRGPDGEWYPTAIDHGFKYSRYVNLGEDGAPTHVYAKGQADLASFCNTWLRNIKAQQGL